jgi:predicted nucleic acid-binding protein
MRITVDLNVLLDVAQHRVPFYDDSEEVLRRGRDGECSILLSAHTITTLHYLLEKWADSRLANETVDNCLSDFIISSVGRVEFERARRMPMSDFEDAVVSAVAAGSNSDFIVTRNTVDFLGSSIAAVTPTDFLRELKARHSEE